jgi:hypothetical protein
MGANDQLDAKPGGGGIVDVVLYVSPRIDHHSPTGGLITDEVRGLGETFQVVLGELHVSFFLHARRLVMRSQ